MDHASSPSEVASRATLVSLLRSEKHWVVSSVAESGAPSGAVVGVAVSDDLDLVFDTLDSTRKAANLRRDARVALTMWKDAVTAQIEGLAEPIPPGDPRIAVYLAAFPEGRERLAWPGILHFAVRPRWIRVSDFSGPSPLLTEVEGL